MCCKMSKAAEGDMAPLGKRNGNSIIDVLDTGQLEGTYTYCTLEMFCGFGPRIPFMSQLLEAETNTATSLRIAWSMYNAAPSKNIFVRSLIAG